MNGLLKLAAAVLVAGLWPSALTAQEPNPEIAALSNEWLKLYNAGQYDAAIAVAQKRVRLTEQVYGVDSEQVANAANTLALSYHNKRDLANAEINYRRALTHYEKLGLVKDNWPLCRTLNSLGDVAYGRLNMEAAARMYERALACSEALLGPADSMTVRHVFDLIEAYNYPVYRPDLAAKADLLAQRWVPLFERGKGPDHLDVVRLLREQGKALAARKDPAGARAVRLRALAIAAKQADPAKPDKARLKLEADLAGDLAGALTWSHPEHIRYTARELAVSERLLGPADPRVVAKRDYVAKLLQTFPDAAAAAGVLTPSPPPVRQAAAPVPAAPARPSPELARPSQGLKLTPQNAVLRPPKGYEHLKPAQLYSISIDALGDPRWIVAGSKAEAMEIGTRFYGFYDRFNGCMAGCPETIALDFGWVAIIQAFRPGIPGSRGDTRKFGVYVAYGAGSRQTAIDGVLAEYRQKSGADGPIMQSLRVGLVSQLDWPRIEGAFNRIAKVGSIPNMEELNYKTFCNWGEVREADGRIGPNMDPMPLKGGVDGDPKCKTGYRPDEKLPPPVLVAGKR